MLQFSWALRDVVKEFLELYAIANLKEDHLTDFK
jgi:hypothetical protein